MPKVLTIRNVSDKTYENIKALAKRNHRSIQQQVRLILEMAQFLDQDRTSPLENARAMRKRLRDRTQKQKAKHRHQLKEPASKNAAQDMDALGDTDGLGDTVAEVREERDR